MKLFISIINHNHDQMIISNPTLKQLAVKHNVILKSNTVPSQKLVEYCVSNHIILLQSHSINGFGANNNEVYRYAKIKLNMSDSDFFLVLNPDVEITLASIDKLISDATSLSIDIASINLYKNKDMTIYDYSIRHYPSLLSPIKSLLGIKENNVYNKEIINIPIKIEWAAGSFLLFKAASYNFLNGFDERYFMYFEDVDICRRANKNNLRVIYMPNIKAIHYTSHQNRNLLSKHFIWYLKSLVRYFLSRNVTK